MSCPLPNAPAGLEASYQIRKNLVGQLFFEERLPGNSNWQDATAVWKMMNQEVIVNKDYAAVVNSALVKEFEGSGFVPKLMEWNFVTKKLSSWVHDPTAVLPGQAEIINCK